jgi:UDP-N-acetyl-D-glucosamine dehydrogenase
VLGAAYKPDVDDCRESPAVELMELLQDRGARVTYNDPHVPALPPLRGHEIRLRSTPLSPETLAGQDCVLIATDHKAYDWPMILQHATLIVDTRGATRRFSRDARAEIVTA